MKLASSPSKTGIEAMINKYFYSVNYSVIDDLKVYNSKLDKFFDAFSVTVKRGRYIFQDSL